MPPPVIPLPQLYDCLSEYRINQWQTCIQTEDNILRASTPSIKGPNTNAISSFLVKAVKWLAEETPLLNKDDALDVTVKHLDNIYSLFVSHPTFRVYDLFLVSFILIALTCSYISGNASGRGLIRTVYRGALEKTKKSDCWTPSATKGYHILNLPLNVSLDIRDKTKDYQVLGNLAALFLSHLAIGPDPISPFVLLAASVDNIDEFNFDINFARATIHDEETLTKIQRIIALRADEVVKEDWLLQLGEDVLAHVCVVPLDD